MVFKSAIDVEHFRTVINSCESSVYLKSPEGDVLNLKSALSQYVAIGRLVAECGDALELFADSKEDEQKLIGFLVDLDNKNI